MDKSGILLSQSLAKPETLSGLSLVEWDLLVRQARCCDLLAHLHGIVTNESRVPDLVEKHLASAREITDRHADLVRFEVSEIAKALDSLNEPVILLKGAAYVMADLPPAKGRLFVDIDILVPKRVLSQAEGLLHQSGWYGTHHNAYDQKYYRKWMHELPPMKHGQRQTILDLHHAILPETARLHPDSSKLIASALPLENVDNLYVLCPEDMILHSATHLFHDGEFEHGLRDLNDLASLLKHFSAESDFWPGLLSRAVELDLARPLHYALHYCNTLLALPVPDSVLSSSRNKAKLSPLKERLMDNLLIRGLLPDHESCRDAGTGMARWLLYIRSHFLRMPLHLLLPHLLYKAFITPVIEWREEKKGLDRPSINRLFEIKKQL